MDLRRTLKQEGVTTTAPVRELSFTRPDGTALGAWVRARDGEVHYLDLSDSSVSVTRPGQVVDFVAHPNFETALPPDVVKRPAWTAYLQARLLWPLAGTVVAFLAIVAIATR